MGKISNGPSAFFDDTDRASPSHSNFSGVFIRTCNNSLAIFAKINRPASLHRRLTM